MRPSRLGLARVSVLRGQGPSKGAACIDDYIKCAEPVYDYLTKFRWLPPSPPFGWWLVVVVGDVVSKSERV